MSPLLPVPVLLVVYGAAVGWVGWSAWRGSSGAPGGWRIAGGAARLLAITALLVVALNPGRWREEAHDRPQEWAMLVDASQSMNVRDAGSGQTRWEAAKGWAKRAADAADDGPSSLRFFMFSSRADPVSLDWLVSRHSDGSGTDVAGAGLRAMESYADDLGRLRGLVLATDGRHVGPGHLEELAGRARASGIPIYAVCLGGEVARRDLALVLSRRHWIAFAGQPVELTGRVAGQGAPRVAVAVRAKGSGGAVGEQRVTIEGESSAPFAITVRPEGEGYHRYRLEVDSFEGETQVGNNAGDVGVTVLSGELRLLMAEAQPHWDTKFLAQLFQRHPNIRLELVYRLGEDKLFGLDASRGGSEVRRAFPGTAEALKAFDVVILGRGAEAFVEGATATALERYVAEGGILWFNRGRASSSRMSPLERLEPIQWENRVAGGIRWEPTVLGEEVGLFGGSVPGRGARVWREVPELEGALRAGEIRELTQVLAEAVVGEGSRVPVVASRRLGSGLVVAINSDGMWRWDFLPKQQGAKELFQNFWMQLLAWSIRSGDFVPAGQWALRLSSGTVETGRPVRATVRRRGEERDEAWMGPWTGPPTLVARRDGALVREWELSAVGEGSDRRWEAVVTMEEEGSYEFQAQGQDDRVSGPETLVVVGPADELDELSADRASLEYLAQATGGSVLEGAELCELLQAPASAPDPTGDMPVEWHSHWDRWSMLLLSVGLLSVDWVIRRRWGLA